MCASLGRGCCNIELKKLSAFMRFVFFSRQLFSRHFQSSNSHVVPSQSGDKRPNFPFIVVPLQKNHSQYWFKVFPAFTERGNQPSRHSMGSTDFLPKDARKDSFYQCRPWSYLHPMLLPPANGNFLPLPGHSPEPQQQHPETHSVVRRYDGKIKTLNRTVYDGKSALGNGVCS